MNKKYIRKSKSRIRKSKSKSRIRKSKSKSRIRKSKSKSRIRKSKSKSRIRKSKSKSRIRKSRIRKSKNNKYIKKIPNNMIDGVTNNTTYFIDKIVDYESMYLFEYGGFNRSIHFLIHIKQDCVSKLFQQLFTFSTLQDDFTVYIKSKTILGFFIISGQINIFKSFVDYLYNLYDSNTKEYYYKKNNILPGDWTCNSYNKQITNKANKTINTLFDCLNGSINNLTNCTNKDVKKNATEFLNILEKNKHYTNLIFNVINFNNEYNINNINFELYNEYFGLSFDTNMIKSDFIIKFSNLMYYMLFVDQYTSNLIINHYILKVFKSQLTYDYHIELKISSEVPDKYKYLYSEFLSFNDKIQIIDYFTVNYTNNRRIPSCGETTLLNMINLFLIDPETNKFNISNLKDTKLKEFYIKYPDMETQVKDKLQTTIDWLDVVSNLTKREIYHDRGDIINDKRNIIYVLQQILNTDKDNFIDIIQELNHNNYILKINIETDKTINITVDDKYEINFVKGHGYMIKPKKDNKKEIEDNYYKKMSDNNFQFICKIFSKINMEQDYQTQLFFQIIEIIRDKEKEKRKFSEEILYIFINQITSLNLNSIGIQKNSYIFKYLNLFKNINNLLVSENYINKIEGIDNLVNLRELNLSKNYINKIEGIDNLVNLRQLNLSHNQINKIEVSNLVDLQILNLSNNQLNKIEGLDNLVNLQILNLSHNQINKIEGLDNLVNLRQLNLSITKINKIEGLGNLVNLRQLNLSMNQINKIEGLGNLVNLQKLILGVNEINKIEGLDNLVDLQILDLYGNRINKIEGLDNLVDLQELNLESNQINKIEGLDNLVNLRQLNLSNNRINKIEGLNNLVNLQKLILSGNKINKIEEGLDNLVNLRELNLIGNKINKIEGLSNLVNLQKLNLFGNKINKIEGIDNLVNLQYFDLQGYL
jgi:Leucine-rich repeat (LRR) protein